MKNLVIASLNFSPGHIAHLRALSLLASYTGFNPILLLNEKYKKFECEIGLKCAYDTSVLDKNISLILIYNISLKNINLIHLAKRKHIKTIYVLHEPYSGLLDLVNEGKNCLRMLGAALVNQYLCYLVDAVILPSVYANKLFEENILNKTKEHYLFPLVFDDLFKSVHVERSFFSYIGNFAPAHGSSAFLDFLEYANEHALPIKFKIATSNDISQFLSRDNVKELIKKGNLLVQHGNPISVADINGHYKSSFCVWNLYRKSTQSGVLGNSFMMGTPVITNRIGNVNKMALHEQNSIVLDNDQSNESIYKAYNIIINDFNRFSDNARKTFINNYYYLTFADSFKKIMIQILKE